MSEATVSVFATADIGDAAIHRLRDYGYDVEVYPYSEPPPREVILGRVRSGIHALITTLRDPIDAEILHAGAGTLRVLAQCAAGVDNVDLATASRLGIPVANTGGVLTEATAEFALFMMGTVSRKLHQSESLIERGEWVSWHPYLPFLGDEITGKTIAIIGAGRIGKAMARKCIGLDMDITLCSLRSRDDQFVSYADRELQLRYEAGFSRRRCRISYAEFETALAHADYVSLHVPLVAGPPGATTYHLMNEEAFRSMKRTGYLINTSRGQVVDEAALYGALVSGEIAGAALDVFEREPLPGDSPLRDPALKDRLRLFHHFASGTRETRLSIDPEVGMAGRTVQAIIDVIENRYEGDPARMPFVVNKDAFSEPGDH